MFKEIIAPRFCETDALGHINNSALPIWFEKAREPAFRMFTPDMNPKKWNLILARIDVDYLAQIFYGKEIEVTTVVGKIGNSSFTVVHEVFQDGTLCARGNAVLIHFDYQQQASKPIPDDVRVQLREHLENVL